MRVKSSKDLARIIAKLIGDPARSNQMADRARLFANESDTVLDHTVTRLQGLL